MADLTRTNPQDITLTGTDVEQGFVNDDADIKAIYQHLNKLRKGYKGAIAPLSPNVGDKWEDSSTTPSVWKEWDGDSWEPIKINSNQIVGNNRLLVAETIVSSAATSISFTGLDAIAHGGYVLTGHIINTSASTASYSFFMNNDTIQANYQYQYLVGSGASTAAGSANNASLLSAGAGVTANFTLNIDPSSMSKTSIYGSVAATGSIVSAFLEKTAVIANLTQLDIVGSVSNSIGIGSVIRLYRRL
jgi:hypothetical protein